MDEEFEDLFAHEFTDEELQELSLREVLMHDKGCTIPFAIEKILIEIEKINLRIDDINVIYKGYLEDSVKAQEDCVVFNDSEADRMCSIISEHINEEIERIKREAGNL